MDFVELLAREQELLDACEADPGLWNLLEAEREWLLYGDACDPLFPSAPEHFLKLLQRDIYLELWGDTLSRIVPGARVLVAGGGTGRFAQILAQRGFATDLLDASPQAIRRARQHLDSSVVAAVGDLNLPHTLPPATYDLVLAVEVPCYATVPGRIMQNLRAALRPGGTLLFSVEARPGALLADRDLASPSAVLTVLERGCITLPGRKHVHYFTRDEAGGLAVDAGLQVTDVQGVCYVPDGPFGGLVDAMRLQDASHIEQLRQVERLCRTHPTLQELPRAWAVTAVAA